MEQPPGREIFARPLRASNGPMTRNDARMRRTRSYGADVDDKFDASISSTPFCGFSI